MPVVEIQTGVHPFLVRIPGDGVAAGAAVNIHSRTVWSVEQLIKHGVSTPAQSTAVTAAVCPRSTATHPAAPSPALVLALALALGDCIYKRYM
jgi:hypothetical protein